MTQGTPPNPPRWRPPNQVEFLERDSYRQRRFRDAARVIPLFAAILMVLPLMWPHDDSPTSSGIVYLFGLWFALVVIAFALSRVLKFERAEDVGDGIGGKAGGE